MVGPVGVRLGKSTFRKKCEMKRKADERKNINFPTFRETSKYWVSAWFK